jgi:putative acetyltransferase
MHVRAYRIEDAEPLMRLYADTVHQVNGRDYSPRQIAAWAPHRAGDLRAWRERFALTRPLVAAEAETLIGFAELDGDGRIGCFYVHHAWQDRGVGRLLMGRLFEEARRRGITELHSEVSLTSRGFFERHGFWVVRTQEVAIQGQPIETFAMERTLAASGLMKALA